MEETVQSLPQGFVQRNKGILEICVNSHGAMLVRGRTDMGRKALDMHGPSGKRGKKKPAGWRAESISKGGGLEETVSVLH